MVEPTALRPSAKIDIISSYERQIIAIVGQERLLALYHEAKELSDEVVSYYKQILAPETLNSLVAILGKDCLLSIRLVELEAFIKGAVKENNMPVCVDEFEQASTEMLKSSLDVVNQFTCTDAIRLRDLELLKKLKELNRGWYRNILRFADDHCQVGSPFEIQKSQAISHWIRSVQSDWK